MKQTLFVVSKGFWGLLYSYALLCSARSAHEILRVYVFSTDNFYFLYDH